MMSNKGLNSNEALDESTATNSSGTVSGIRREKDAPADLDIEHYSRNPGKSDPPLQGCGAAGPIRGRRTQVIRQASLMTDHFPYGCPDPPNRDYHGMTLRSRQNLPVSFCGASAASQTMPAAPSAMERVAFDPPMSVRTQPGQTELTAKFGRAAASCEVTPFNAVFEMQ